MFCAQATTEIVSDSATGKVARFYVPSTIITMVSSTFAL